MKRNKSAGFTLIELLVAIVVVMSILALAIVSITKVSKQKKKEAKKRVIEQVETAALNYFATNEYQFESITNDDDGTCTTKACYGVVPVGELVKNDYINVVTNPETGKKLNACDLVEIKKTGSKYVVSKYVEYDPNDTDRKCSNDTSPYVSLVSIDDSSLGNLTHTWYKYKTKTGKTVSTTKYKFSDSWINVGLQSNLKINFIKSATKPVLSKLSISYCIKKNGSTCNNSNYKNYTDSLTINGSKSSGWYTILKLDDNDTNSSSTSSSGTKIYYKVKYKNESEISINDLAYIDKDNPNCNVSYDGYTLGTTSNRPVIVTNTCSDVGYSGCKKTGVIEKLTINTTTTPTFNPVEDKAGNKGNCSAQLVKVESVNPVCKLTISSTDDSKKHNGWYNIKTGNPTISYEVEPGAGENITKITFDGKTKTALKGSTTKTASTEKTGKVYKLTATNEFGKTCSDEVTLYYDKNYPTISFTDVKNATTTKTSTWVNKKATFGVSVTDQTSGIDTTAKDGKMMKIEWNASTTGAAGSGYCSNTSDDTCTIKTITNGYERTNGGLAAQGNREEKFFVCDIAGNCKSSTIYANIDTGNPNVTLARSNGSETFSGSGSDSLSGIVAYAFSTESDSSKISSWTNVTNTKNYSGFSKKVTGNKEGKIYYLHLKDAAGNIGKSNKGSYKYCEVTKKKTPTNYSDGTIAKIFRFKLVSGGQVCTGSEPKNVYDFLEYQCVCNVDTLYNKNCGYDSIVDITLNTHNNDFKDGFGRLKTRVYYKNSDNGRAACRNQSNTYVNYVCDENYATSNSAGGLTFHGYKWYSDAGNSTYNKFKSNTGNGYWYHNGGDYNTIYEGTNANISKACNTACNAKYGAGK